MNAMFKDREEYLEWCGQIVSRIYYRNITMDSDGIRDVVKEIATRLHRAEGQSLYEREES